MYSYRFSFVLLIVIAMLASVPVRAQEVDDTIKIKTRVVFLDALVKDKKTDLPVSNLTQENFEVLDDGKPRAISYFTRQGEARKPLALIMVLDLRADGAGRFLKQPEILKAMEKDATEEIIIRDNVIFNSLTVELRTLLKFLLPIGKPIAGWVGLSIYGSARHLAQRSGGEAVKVGRVKDYR